MTKNKTKMTVWSNYKPQKGYQSFEGEVSIVVPDKAFTIQQIFDKFRRGISLNIEREPLYSDTDNFDHPDGFEIIDITDVADLTRRLKEDNEFRAKAEAKPVEAPVTRNEEPVAATGFAEANNP